MKILYLLPPSEGKNTGGDTGKEKLSFSFEKPSEIAINATEKDLKCKGARYEEGVKLNASLCHPELGSGSLEKIDSETSSEGQLFLPAISRYSGVMYNAINYKDMPSEGKQYFDNNFLILSGMYGILRPQDTIGNYKLPIETKGLYAFWGEQVTDMLNTLEVDYIVDFLPNSYKKMIRWDKLKAKIIKVDFFSYKNGEQKKMTHGVKKIKGEYIHNICNKNPQKLENFPGEKVQISENEYHISVIQN